MKARVLLAILAIALPGILSGCIGLGESGSLLEATNVEPTGRVVELDAWVETIHQEIFPGYTAELWAFCFEAHPGSEDAVTLRDGKACSVPGPTLNLDQGDRLIVHFRNPHSFPHTIHWHGQLVDHEDDGVPGMSQNTTEQGHEYTYDYIVERQGTLWYHCHVDTQHHVFMGLYGAIKVDPQDDSMEPEADQDYTFVLSHGNKAHMAVPGPDEDPHAEHRGQYGSGNPGKQNGPFDVEYDLFMINGKSFPLTVEDEQTSVHTQEGEVVRMRFINAGFMTETMHLHGHDMVVTHKDGLPLSEEARFKADTLRIAPGERYDVAVMADNPGKWPLHTHFPQHVTNDHMYPGGMLTDFVYEGFEDLTFRSELPGGLAEGAQDEGPPMPADYTNQETAEVSTATDYNQSFKFPVEDERAQKVEVKLTLESNSPLPVDELTLTLYDAEGQALDSRTVNQDEPVGTISFADVPNTGTYTATIAGQALDASYTLDLLVDYPDAAGGGGHGGHAGH